MFSQGLKNKVVVTHQTKGGTGFYLTSFFLIKPLTIRFYSVFRLKKIEVSIYTA